MPLKIIAAIVIAYLLGSIPFAYIASRLSKGVDIREVGGGNMGALNVMREIGAAAGYAVWLADIVKGMLAVLTARWMGLDLPWLLATGFASVIGHNFPVFLKFRGGKGGATIMGVLLALVPLEFLSGFAITAVIVFITSNPALGFGVGLAFVPLFTWWYNGSGMLIGYVVFLFLFVASRFIISGLRKVNDNPEVRKNLIFSRDYHFWQVKKDDSARK
ncbi:MAG: glycerol-3-phosphate 1-O-acyltransferase PlsY [Dehalococcoidales bacterium]|nr:glycerol-3-phosphate 1-O-acyltransferase PlsY [Dehalococcoidales bacterium]